MATPIPAVTTTMAPTLGPALGAALGRDGAATGGLRKESSRKGLPRRPAKADNPKAGRAMITPKRMAGAGSIPPATIAQETQSATSPASTPQPSVAIMIGSGARYASANASVVPWTVTTKRSGDARPAQIPV